MPLARFPLASETPHFIILFSQISVQELAQDMATAHVQKITKQNTAATVFWPVSNSKELIMSIGLK